MKKYVIALMLAVSLLFAGQAIAENHTLSPIVDGMDIFSWASQLSLDGDTYYLFSGYWAFGVSALGATMFDDMLEIRGHYVTDFNWSNDKDDLYGPGLDANVIVICDKYCDKIPVGGAKLKDFLNKFDSLGLGFAGLVDGRQIIEDKKLDIDPAIHFRIVRLF